MATLTNIVGKCFNNPNTLLEKLHTNLKVSVRFASKKMGSTTKNAGNSKPKHRGWKKQDGSKVTENSILVLQNTTRFHPGLNVGFGKNGTLFAKCDGKVVITSEKIKPNWEHTWIQKNYAGREGQVLYKKHFNVIPVEPQHNRFKLINTI